MSEQNIVNTTMQTEAFQLLVDIFEQNAETAAAFQLLVAIFEQNAETTAAVLQGMSETQRNELIDLALTAESEEMLAKARQVFNEAFNTLKEKAAQ